MTRVLDAVLLRQSLILVGDISPDMFTYYTTRNFLLLLYKMYREQSDYYIGSEYNGREWSASTDM